VLPELQPGDLGLPSAEDPIRIRWLGTAGFEIEHGGHVLLIDPYLTRASLRRCVLAPLVPDLALIDQHAARADAIVVGHTHFDHVLDVPAIARRTGAVVFGSHSAATLCRTSGVPESQIHDVERPSGSPPVVMESGPFRLRFVPNAHARLVLGKVPFAGEITDCEEVPLRVNAYRCGAVFRVEITVAGKTLVHVGSAALIETESARLHDVDAVLLCAAGWHTSRDLPERVVRAFSPRAIVLTHWDNFFLALTEPARPLPALQLPRLFDRLVGAAPAAKIGTVPLLEDVLL